jgi:hypothetical protein
MIPKEKRSRVEGSGTGEEAPVLEKEKLKSL